MLKFAQERDSILRVRAKVDKYDEDLNAAEAAAEDVVAASDRVKLCAPQKLIGIMAFASLIALEFPEIKDFVNQLVRFAKTNRLQELSSPQRVKSHGVRLLL